MSRPGRPRASAPPAEVLAARQRAECLVSAADVSAAVDRLSVRLSLRLQDTNPILLTIMNGALPFAGALLPRLNFPLEVGFLHVGRYRDATRGGDLVWHSQPTVRLHGRTVVLLDDVLDEGKTLAALVEWVRDAGAAEVVTAVLVDKQIATARPLAVDYAALECPDRYLFGCGMDYQGYWRNLPDIHALPVDLESAGHGASD
ncbi:MAG: hypoxanthine-guanine phosphoribosyltransferase [Pseudomonadales bacterium]